MSGAADIPATSGKAETGLPKFSSPEALRPASRFLNRKDLDVLYLYFVAGKRQKEVQLILDRTQPSLSYDTHRILQRMKFIDYLLSTFDTLISFLERSQGLLGAEEERTRRVLVLMYYTTSLTHAAALMGERQIKVRYLFEKALLRMEELGEWPAYELFSAVKHNLNLVRRHHSANVALRSDSFPLSHSQQEDCPAGKSERDHLQTENKALRLERQGGHPCAW